MKKLVYLGLILLSIQQARAQMTAPKPATRVAVSSRDDDTFLLALIDTPEATWRRLAQVLALRGYSIEHSDKELLTLSTYPLEVPGYPIRVTGLVMNNALVLRMYQSRDLAPGREPNERIRRRGSDNWEWRELEAIAREIGGPVTYATSTAQ